MHPVDEMRADIGERVALLPHVEIPGRTRVRDAGDDLHQVVRTGHRDPRFGQRAGDLLAENLGVAVEEVR